jgi:hypothetical protein
MSNIKKYAVSDQTGQYVFFSDDYQEVEAEMRDINETLSEGGSDETAAIMKRVDGTEHYELYY